MDRFYILCVLFLHFPKQMQRNVRDAEAAQRKFIDGYAAQPKLRRPLIQPIQYLGAAVKYAFHFPATVEHFKCRHFPRYLK